MNPITEEILLFNKLFSEENSTAKDILLHYGMPRRSGRYPYGSGEDPYQHGSMDFLGRIETLKAQGWTETPENIMDEFGLTTGQYRQQKSICKDERKLYEVAKIKSMISDGKSVSDVARALGINESSVRSKLNPQSIENLKVAKNTAEFIKKQIDEKGMVEVGVGVERELNVSREQFDKALQICKNDGYEVWGGRVPQVTNPNQKTTITVACKPGTEHRDIFDHPENIKSLNDYISRDDGLTFEKKFHYPESLDSSRVKVVYGDEIGPNGHPGVEKDGLIELRRNVPDLSLGESRYSQVRILMDNKMYAKGMAVYSDNIPDGYDMIFYTNKKTGTPFLNDDPNGKSVFKAIKNDPDNPFGSLIKDASQGGQYWYDDPKTGEKKLGLINKRADEGDWSEWKDALPAQFLSKQSLGLAKKQLDLAASDKYDEFDSIMSITNPTVKKYYLDKFASECDSAAVHLQAAALPGQKFNVLIPINSLKDDEVYAPRYENGTKLALVRYPHGGTFEIPVVTVNNKHQPAIDILGKDIGDAIGINSHVAERLSGADFDGDTAMCIPTDDPNGRVKITRSDPLKGLEGFDPKSSYPYREGMHVMKNTGKEMGVITNLITDMQLVGAEPDEVAAAVRHSMVVIDAEKHKLDYKRSEIDNNIAALKAKYQRTVDEDGNIHVGGASTLVSRAKSQESVIKRQGTPRVNIKGKEWYDPTKPEGALIYKNADNAEYTYRKVNKKTGEVVEVTDYRMQQSTKMAEVDDARKLISAYNNPMEVEYADYANKMKALANQARKESYYTENVKVDKTAKEIYAKEVKSLEEKLNSALLNAPRERYSNIQAYAEIEAKKKAYRESHDGQDMKPKDVKKISQVALTKYRTQNASIKRKDRNIVISDREWEAIQSGAVTENTLKRILNNSDPDSLRQRATPKAVNTLSDAKKNRIKAMQASNYTLSEIANKLGVSPSTVSKYLKGE